MIAALLAGIVALLIPQVLRSLVDGPLKTGDASQIWPAVGIVLVLGVLEAVLIALRRWFVLQPGTHVEASLRNALYAQSAGPAGWFPRPLAVAVSCCRARSATST